MSNLCDASRSILIIVDLQERLMPAIDEGAEVVKNAVILAKAAKVLGVPVIGTAQNPAGLGPNLPEIHALCDWIISKTDFDACAEPGFLAAVETARDDLIVLGCEAHVCALQTVLGLRARQHSVRFVVDAIGSRHPLNKTMAINRAKEAGAQLVTSEMVLFEWLRNSRHQNFRELTKLIK